MATSLRAHIIATFIAACASVALLVAAFATPTWVEATIVAVNVNVTDPWRNDLNYGLFSGHINVARSNIGGEQELKMSCDMSENMCVVSCWDNEEKRKEELLSLQTKKKGIGCDWAEEPGECDGKCTTINAYMWLFSVLFLAFALLASTLAAVFGVVNTTTNPIEPILSIPGLFIWNGAAVTFIFLVLALWGALFSQTLSHNIAYSETITGQFVSEGSTSLGVSYWLLLVALFLHVGNIWILNHRQYQLAHEPPLPTIKMEENTDGIIFLY